MKEEEGCLNRREVADLINAGRVFQSAWLHAHGKLIAFQPTTKISEEAPWRMEVAKKKDV